VPIQVRLPLSESFVVDLSLEIWSLMLKSELREVGRRFELFSMPRTLRRTRNVEFKVLAPMTGVLRSLLLLTPSVPEGSGCAGEHTLRFSDRFC
jgi:hypothetical protein